MTKMSNNINKKTKYDIMKLVIKMSKSKRKEAEELGAYVVFGAIVSFFTLIFYFVKLVIKEMIHAIKENKRKEKSRLKDQNKDDQNEYVKSINVINQKKNTRKEKIMNEVAREEKLQNITKEDMLDNLTNLISQAEEIYDEALLNNIDLDSEYLQVYNIKDEVEDENIEQLSIIDLEMLEDELLTIIDDMNQKAEKVKEDKEAKLKVASVLLAEKYLFEDEADEK